MCPKSIKKVRNFGDSRRKGSGVLAASLMVWDKPIDNRVNHPMVNLISAKISGQGQGEGVVATPFFISKPLLGGTFAYC